MVVILYKKYLKVKQFLKSTRLKFNLVSNKNQLSIKKRFNFKGNKRIATHLCVHLKNDLNLAKLDFDQLFVAEIDAVLSHQEYAYHLS